MKRKPLHSIGIASCLVNLNGEAPMEFRLLPAGIFKAKDGRPKGLRGWVLNDKNAPAVLRNTQAVDDSLLIDYEHQTLYTEKTGKEAKASGWVERGNLEWRVDDGLYVTNVEWTTAAKKAILEKEYRYISPVLTYNKQTGEVTAVLMAALVNYPAIEGLTDLAAAHFHFPTNPEDNPVDEELLALLGLSADADIDAQKTAITALKTQADNAANLETEVAALKTAGSPDPAKFVPVETMAALKDQVAVLTAQVNGKEVSELVQTGLNDGRLLPEQEAWATSLGQSDIAALKGYLDSAQPIAALKGSQTGGQQPPETDANGLTADELAVCKATGIDPDDYKKTKRGE